MTAAPAERQDPFAVRKLTIITHRHIRHNLLQCRLFLDKALVAPVARLAELVSQFGRLASGLYRQLSILPLPRKEVSDELTE
jgi:hypothetical protein